MADYVQQTDFSAKDALPSGDPNKLIRGSDVDAEFEAIETAIASKEDSANKGLSNGYPDLDSAGKVPIAQLYIATNAEVAGATTTAKLMTPGSIPHIEPSKLAEPIYAVSIRPGLLPVANAGGYGTLSAASNGTGSFTLTHNFGTTAYVVVPGNVDTLPGDAQVFVHIEKGTNTFTVNTYNEAGSLVDADVDLIIVQK